MSWITRQEHREFSRTLAEPDMETLNYWVQRLEPLIKAELEREIIVVFCNRCGQESEALYAGTGAIVGIQDGGVNVYALAGRGTKEYLVADTNSPPFAKLIQSHDEDRDTPISITSMMNMEPTARPTPPPPPPPFIVRG
jgi:protein N-terminal amidase